MIATSTSTLESARNTLRLLRVIGARGTISVTEASRVLCVGKSTAHRLLMTLVASDFATRDPGTRRYYAGPEAVAAGLSSLWDFDVQWRTREPLRRLAVAIGETAKLLVLDGPYARVLDEAGTNGSLRVGSTLGKLLPANATAAGKVLLAALDEDQLRSRLSKHLPSLTPRTIDDWDSLSVELQNVRSRGWASSEGESTPGVHGISVPVVGVRGWTIGALAIVAPESRMTRTTRMEILGRLLHTSRELSRLMTSPDDRRTEAKESVKARASG